MNDKTLSHLDEHGASRMVDVSEKHPTLRTAAAAGEVAFPPDVYAQIQAANGKTAKGTIAETARIADNERCGGFNCLVGWVRRHNDGK